jgi:hypothetical protein
MRKLLMIGSLAIAAVVWSSQARAFGELPFWNWPAYYPDAPYWPAYRPTERVVGEDCVRWNWQEHSYYNYCGDFGRYVPRSRSVVRVRG